MPKRTRKQPGRFPVTGGFIQMGRAIKHQTQKLLRNLKPYLAWKFWPLYLLSFGLGVYLWGPSHGLQKIYHWKLSEERQIEKNPSVETLRRELGHLKQQLQLEQSKKVEPVFNPHSFSRPALGQIEQGFEWTGSGKSWRLHPGVDIRLPAGSNIMAAAAGTISKIELIPGGYFTVTVDHGAGWESLYSGLVDLQVQEGQKVIKGVIIGTSSPAGIHTRGPGFHFGLFHDRQPVDPKNIIEGL